MNNNSKYGYSNKIFYKPNYSTTTSYYTYKKQEKMFNPPKPKTYTTNSKVINLDVLRQISDMINIGLPSIHRF